MQIRPLALRVPAFKRFLLLLIALFLCLNTSPLPIPNSETCSFGIADAAPTPLRAQSTRALTSNSAKTHREIELVSSTSQGVTIQLVIPKSDFLFMTHQPPSAGSQFPESLEISNVAGPTLSFPGCNFTTEPGMLRLPMQSTLISVPPDVDFQLRVIDKDFSTHKIEAIALTSNKQKDRFFPERLTEIRNTGWIRENRVLPIQLNPVQYLSLIHI